MKSNSIEADDPIKDIENRMYDAVRRSATVIVSTQIKKTLGSEFSTPQFIFLLLAMQSVLTVLRSLPGFTAPWNTLRSITQNMVVQTSVAYITESWTTELALLNLSLALAVIDCIPAFNGWIGQDILTFKTSVTFIFSDKISMSIKDLNVSLLAGAFLSACIPPEKWGFLGETFALVGVNLLCEVAFSIVDGGFSLSIIWPVVLLYFVRELSDRYSYFQTYFDFGVYRISEIIYQYVNTIPEMSFRKITILFGFIFFVAPGDKLWGGLCALIVVYAWSDWILKDVLGDIIKTDPLLAGLVLVTCIYFIGFVISRNAI
jgi:hypothetical protein